MKEIEGDLWGQHAKGHWVGITTNGDVNRYGQAVMGRGVALEAKRLFTSLPGMLGDRLQRSGNRLFVFGQYHLITIPVKTHWHDQADELLIRLSLVDLVTTVTALDIREFYLVRPGCGNGGLEWSKVRPDCERILDDRFVIIEKPRKDEPDDNHC